MDDKEGENRIISICKIKDMPDLFTFKCKTKKEKKIYIVCEGSYETEYNVIGYLGKSNLRGAKGKLIREISLQVMEFIDEFGLSVKRKEVKKEITYIHSVDRERNITICILVDEDWNNHLIGYWLGVHGGGSFISNPENPTIKELLEELRDDGTWLLCISTEKNDYEQQDHMEMSVSDVSSKEKKLLKRIEELSRELQQKDNESYVSDSSSGRSSNSDRSSARERSKKYSGLENEYIDLVTRGEEKPDNSCFVHNAQYGRVLARSRLFDEYMNWLRREKGLESEKKISPAPFYNALYELGGKKKVFKRAKVRCRELNKKKTQIQNPIEVLVSNIV